MEGLGLCDDYARVHCTLVPRMSVKFQTQTETRHSTTDAEQRKEIAGLLVEADDGSPRHAAAGTIRGSFCKGKNWRQPRRTKELPAQ